MKEKKNTSFGMLQRDEDLNDICSIINNWGSEDNIFQERKEKSKEEKEKKQELKEYFEFGNSEYSLEDLNIFISDIWFYEFGKRKDDFKEVSLYIKPEELEILYVFNGSIIGSKKSLKISGPMNRKNEIELRNNNIFIQFSEKSYSFRDLERIVKDYWVYDLKKEKEDLKCCEIHIKTKEEILFYEINEEIKGRLAI